MFWRTRWQRRKGATAPELLDRVIATLFTAGNLAILTTMSLRGPVPIAVASVVACNSAVAIRRRHPTLAAVVVTAAVCAYQLTTRDQQGAFEAAAVVLVFYLVGKHEFEARDGRRLSLLLIAVFAGGAVAASSVTGGLLGWGPVIVAPMVIGAAVARSERISRALAEAVNRLKEEQKRRAGEAAGEERLRVARDLHDVVAHGVSVMVIQAGAARLIGANDVDAGRTALQVVVASGREAMADLRRIMGALRRDADVDASPGGLAQLGLLVGRIRGGGVPTDLEVEGPLDRLSPALDLVGYRVVQEALTNVVKHAGPACVQVRVRVDNQSLDIDVIDTGNGASIGSQPASSGQGLRGMRERVSSYGGQLRTGSRTDGGFEVSAHIPLVAPPLPDPDRSNLPAELSARHRLLIATRRWADVAIAAAWFIGLQTEAATSAGSTRSHVLDAVLVGLMTIAAVWRRRGPLVFLLLVGGLAALLNQQFDQPDKSTLIGAYTLVVPLFTVAAWESRRRAVVGLILFGVGATTLAVTQRVPLGGIAGALIMGCVIWAVGRVARSQRRVAAELAQTTALLETEREGRARLAVASERTRIARELNALVARGVIAMVVQAEAAQQLLDRDPAGALAAIGSIEEAGREALAQLRRLLGVLRAPHAARELSPQPGLDQLHALIQRSRDNGQPVELAVIGDPGPLAPGVDLVVYRVVQEAISHCEHQNGRSPLHIILSFAADRVELDVRGHLLQTAEWPTASIRERIALYDGEMWITDRPNRARRTVVSLPRAMQGAWA
jgi:signal transduction histidine kinase